MKAIYVINSLEGGGAERVFSKLVTLIYHDSNTKYEVEVVLLNKTTEVYSIPKGLKVHRIGSFGGVFTQLILFLLLMLRKKPDFVLSFLPRANLFNTVSGYLFNHKSIISERSNSHGRLVGKLKGLKKQLIFWMFQNSVLIIAVSQGVADCIINDFGVSKSKVAVLNNPYDIESIIYLSKKKKDVNVNADVPYIISMGRLVRTKGFYDLIASFSKIDSAHHLVILGQGPDLEKLKRLAIEKNIENKVHFYGFQKNPYPFIAGAEIFVLPSYLEGFPNALVEAMALSKPVLSTNCKDGPSEILSFLGIIKKSGFVQAKYGLLTNAGDVDGLTKGLKALINSPEKKIKYAKQSLIRAGDFSDDKFYEKYINIISEKILG